jgi:hypothetical protein
MAVRCSTRNVTTRMMGVKGQKGDKGDKGDTGSPGADGLGVPPGGNPEEILKKASAQDNDTYWGSVNITQPTLSWKVVTVDYISINNDNIVVDTSNGLISVMLPASPQAGDFVRVKTTIAYTNHVTILRNGEFMMGDAEDYIINGDFVDITFVYVNSNIGWII